MKQILLIAALIAVTNLSHASDNEQGHRLVLLNALSNPAQVGDMVQLQDSNKCRYVGKLVQRGGEAESWWAKLFNQAGGNVGSWSIVVDRAVCGSIEKSVSLTIPLRNVVSKDAYMAVETVVDYPSK